MAVWWSGKTLLGIRIYIYIYTYIYVKYKKFKYVFNEELYKTYKWKSEQLMKVAEK